MFKKAAFIILLSVLLTGCAGKTPTTQSESDEVADLSTQTENKPTVPEDSTVIEESATTEDSTVTEDSIVTENSTVTEDSTIAEDSSVTEDTTITEDLSITEDSSITENSSIPKEPTITVKPETSGNQTSTDKNHSTGKDTTTTTKTSEEVLAEKIISQIITKNMSDYDKAKAINDYIILNVRYDRENYAQNTIPSSCYTALGAMQNGVAVCAGYAKMFQELCMQAGLECTYVTGDSIGGYHAWNQVKVDGKWYNVDTTWNDGDYERHEDGHYYCGCYQYFLLSDETFNKSHTPFGKTYACNENYNEKAVLGGCPYLSQKTIFVETEAELEAIVNEMIKNNESSKSFMVEPYLYNVSLSDVVNAAIKKNRIYDYEFKKTNNYDVYLEYDKIYYCTITINVETTFEDAKIEVATTDNDIKKQLEKGFQSIDRYTHGTLEYFLIYANDNLIQDKYLSTRLLDWAYYEKGIILGIYYDWEKVNDNVNCLKVTFEKATDENYVAHVYDVNELESIIKKMKENGVKKGYIKVYENDHLLVGDLEYQMRENFKKAYLTDLIKQYCFRVELSGGKDQFAGFTLKITMGHEVDIYREKVIQEATCSKEGILGFYCNLCNEIGATEAIPTNDSHTYCWKGDEFERTLSCENCSYTGITEVCIDGVWGYFDEALAKEKFNSINQQRANMWSSIYDWETDSYTIIRPQPLTWREDLTELAKTRVVPLLLCNFKNRIENEGGIQTKYYESTRQVKVIFSGGVDFYDAKYTYVGVSCFCQDRDDSGFNFLPHYAFEFAN